MTGGPDRGSLALAFTKNTYPFEVDRYMSEKKCWTGSRRNSLVDAASDLGVCFDASCWGKVHSRGATVRFGPEKKQNKINKK